MRLHQPRRFLLSLAQQTHHVAIGEPVLVHLQDFPRRNGEACGTGVREHRRFSNKRIAQAVLPLLPSRHTTCLHPPPPPTSCGTPAGKTRATSPSYNISCLFQGMWRARGRRELGDSGNERTKLIGGGIRTRTAFHGNDLEIPVRPKTVRVQVSHACCRVSKN